MTAGDVPDMGCTWLPFCRPAGFDRSYAAGLLPQRGAPVPITATAPASAPAPHPARPPATISGLPWLGLIPPRNSTPLGPALGWGYATFIKLMDCVHHEEAAQAAHCEQLIDNLFRRHLFASPHFHIARGCCIGVWLNAEGLPQGALQDLAGQMAGATRGRAWLQLPDGSTLACDGERPLC